MLQGDLAPEFDVFAGVIEIMPLCVNGERAQDDAGPARGLLGNADLRAVHGTHQDVENIAVREEIDLPIDEIKRAKLLATNLRLFLFLFTAASEKRGRRQGVDRDDSIDAHFRKNINRERFGHTSIDVRLSIYCDWHTDTGNSAARVDGLGDFTAGKDDALEGVQIGGNNP